MDRPEASPTAAGTGIEQTSWDRIHLALTTPTPTLAVGLAVLALGIGTVIGGSVGVGSPGLASGAALLQMATSSPQPASSPDVVADSTPSLSAPEGNVLASSDGSSSTPGPSATPYSAPATTDPTSPSSAAEPTGNPAPDPASDPDPAPDPDPEPANEVSGTVVHLNPAARSYSLAESGPMLPIHAKTLPPAGRQVTVAAEYLGSGAGNGTFAETGKRVLGPAKKKSGFSGAVTFVDPDLRAYVVSVRGASILVHADPAKPDPELPEVGAFVTATVALKLAEPPSAADLVANPAAGDQTALSSAGVPDSCLPALDDPRLKPIDAAVSLAEVGIEASDPAVGITELSGIVRSTCPKPHLLVITADDIRESAHDMVIKVPGSIDIDALKPGKSVTVTADLDANGAFTMTGISRDDGLAGATDTTTAQGDQAGL